MPLPRPYGPLTSPISPFFSAIFHKKARYMAG